MLCKVKLCNLLLELHCAPLSISTAASLTNKFSLDPFVSFSVFFFLSPDKNLAQHLPP